MNFSRRGVLKACATIVAGLALSLAAHAADPVKIGAVLCTSGPFANLGLDEMRGAQLAVEHINAAGGVDGRQLELIVEDDQSRADLGVVRANKLVDQDKVSAMIACYGAGAVAYADMLRKNEVPLFGIIGSAALTQLGNPYVFRTGLGDPTVIESMTSLLQRLGKKRVAVIYQGDTYGKGAADLVAKAAKAKGYEVVADESFPIQANLDLTPQLTRIRSKNPDAIVVWAGTTPDIVALKNMQQLGMKVPVFGGPTMAAPSLLLAAGTAADGVYVPDTLNHGTPDPAQTKFLDDFKKKFNVAPSTSFAMMGYDTIQVVAAAAKGADGHGAKIKANGEKLTNVQGMMGSYSYTPENREGITPASVKWYTISGGKFNRVP